MTSLPQHGPEWAGEIHHHRGSKPWTRSCPRPQPYHPSAVADTSQVDTCPESMRCQHKPMECKEEFHRPHDPVQADSSLCEQYLLQQQYESSWNRHSLPQHYEW